MIRYIPTDIVDTWEIVTDETEEVFYNRITHDFYNKIPNILKEINKEINDLRSIVNKRHLEKLLNDMEEKINEENKD